MTRIDLRKPKKELQISMIGFRRRMEEIGKGNSVNVRWIKLKRQWSNNKDRFETAKERIANGNDKLSPANGEVRERSFSAR